MNSIILFNGNFKYFKLHNTAKNAVNGINNTLLSNAEDVIELNVHIGIVIISSHIQRA